MRCFGTLRPGLDDNPEDRAQRQTESIEPFDPLRVVYAAFNARDIEQVLAALHPDVNWPNGMTGGSFMAGTRASIDEPVAPDRSGTVELTG
jgi:hypothetical protein